MAILPESGCTFRLSQPVGIFSSTARKACCPWIGPAETAPRNQLSINQLLIHQVLIAGTLHALGEVSHIPSLEPAPGRKHFVLSSVHRVECNCALRKASIELCEACAQRRLVQACFEMVSQLQSGVGCREPPF